MYRKKRNRISLRIDVRVDDRRLRCNRIGINNKFSKRNYFYVINKEFDSNGIQCFPFKYSNFPIFEIRFSIHNVYVRTLLPRARSLTSFSRYTSARELQRSGTGSLPLFLVPKRLEEWSLSTIRISKWSRKLQLRIFFPFDPKNY